MAGGQPPLPALLRRAECQAVLTALCAAGEFRAAARRSRRTGVVADDVGTEEGTQMTLSVYKHRGDREPVATFETYEEAARYLNDHECQKIADNTVREVRNDPERARTGLTMGEQHVATLLTTLIGIVHSRSNDLEVKFRKLRREVQKLADPVIGADELAAALNENEATWRRNMPIPIEDVAAAL